jgi:hypothetical protein
MVIAALIFNPFFYQLLMFDGIIDGFIVSYAQYMHIYNYCKVWYRPSAPATHL